MLIMLLVRIDGCITSVLFTAYVNAGWDTIEQEFKELEKIFEEKKAKVAGMAESCMFCLYPLQRNMYER